ncbi:MAG: hypothetical protein ABSB00_01225 [Minisyncoccia bacterium]|jgi:hypothetical protein
MNAKRQGEIARVLLKKILKEESVKVTPEGVLQKMKAMAMIIVEVPLRETMALVSELLLEE